MSTIWRSRYRTKMNKKIGIIRDPAGMTLIEIIAVLVIVSVLAAIVVPRYLTLEVNAQVRALEIGVAELNGRESLVWANVKLSNSGWLNDFPQVWDRVDRDLGGDYKWIGVPNPSGGKLSFDSQAEDLSRDASTSMRPANWSR